MYSPKKKTNQFNESIKVLLHSQNVALEDLAAHLRYDVDDVERQLAARNTFAYADLVKICSFLNQLPSDFLFDRMPADPIHTSSVLNVSPGILALRFYETKLHLVRYFQRRVNYN